LKYALHVIGEARLTTAEVILQATQLQFTTAITFHAAGLHVYSIERGKTVEVFPYPITAYGLKMIPSQQVTSRNPATGSLHFRQLLLQPKSTAAPEVEVE